MWKAHEHMTVSRHDKSNSVRVVCCCGTHFNVNPKNINGTLAWLNNHSKCNASVDAFDDAMDVVEK